MTWRRCWWAGRARRRGSVLGRGSVVIRAVSLLELAFRHQFNIRALLPPIYVKDIIRWGVWLGRHIA